MVFQFRVAVYGGYFGAGIGILMLAALSLMGHSDIHRMNAVKTLLAVCVNGAAAIYFAVTADVIWRDAVNHGSGGRRWRCRWRGPRPSDGSSNGPPNRRGRRSRLGAVVDGYAVMGRPNLSW